MKKTTHELRRGDVILAVDGSNIPTQIVLRIEDCATPRSLALKRVITYDTESESMEKSDMPGATEFTVEQHGTQSITPAQQHADELLEWLKGYYAMIDIKPKGLHALLQKIEPPPAPPTAEEFAAALARMETTVSFDNVQDRCAISELMDRARKAGMI